MSEKKKLRLGFKESVKEVETPLPDNAPAPWDLDTDLKVVGRSHPRLDAVAKVTGSALYSYDRRFPGLIYAKMVRSSHGHARVTRVDTTKAEALKGVLYVESHQGKTVRYAGDGVAAIAAVSEEILDDALALVEVDYDVLPCVVTIEDARKDGAPKVFANRDSNVRFLGRGGPNPNAVARVESTHEQAEVVIEAEYRTQVQTHSCLETHGCVCKWEGDHLTVYASTQGTFAVKQQMMRALRLPADRITVVTEHMGGGFGSKFRVAPWDVFCAKAAKETGRPCRSLLDRREEHLLGGNRPDSIQKCKFSANRDGTLKGALVTSWGTPGVGRGGGVMNPAVYRFEAAHAEQYDVFTHAGAAAAFRAPRHPQGFFALEGMIDELAERIGMDPLALRKKNDPNPVRQAQYDVGEKEIGWHRRTKDGGGKGPVKRGFGMAASRWGHNARPGTVVSCRIGRDGSVLLANGSQDIGTGTRTVIAAVGAEELGLSIDDVVVRLGSTDDPYGHGSGGSVTTPSIAPPTRQAAWEAKRKLLEHVAQAVGGDAATMDLKGGKVVGAPKALTFKQACALLPVETVEAMGQGMPGLFGLPRFTNEVAGVQFAEVEVDTETGRVTVVKVVAVQDCGLVIDPMTARSQIHGGVIQGISYALFEDRLMDTATGNMVNGDFLDYKIVGTLDVPEIVSIPFTVAQGQTTTGASSLGEPPTIPTAGAIGNAVANALGVRVRSLPITPDKVLAALGAI